jgi:nucleotide-binding universal stress UspA family protein
MDRVEAQPAQKEAVRETIGRPGGGLDSDAMSRYLMAEAAMSGRVEPAAEPGTAAVEEPVPVERPLVIAGLDDSAGGYLAVEQAAREAALRGWRLRIMHVQDAPLRPGHLDRLRTAGAQLLADGADRARGLEPKLAVSTELRVGSAAGELINASQGAGLVVVGTRGRGGFSELTTGSVAHHVAAHAQAPVLIVRIPPRPAGPEWIDRPILVGIDGSADAYNAFDFAVAEAGLRGIGVLAVYARPPGRDDEVDPLRAGTLAGVDTQCRGVPVRRRLVERDPRRSLVGLSAPACAVVVAARGRGGFPGLHTGSVSQALIHQSHSPVFVVRGPFVEPRPA